MGKIFDIKFTNGSLIENITKNSLEYISGFKNFDGLNTWQPQSYSDTTLPYISTKLLGKDKFTIIYWFTVDSRKGIGSASNLVIQLNGIRIATFSTASTGRSTFYMTPDYTQGQGLYYNMGSSHIDFKKLNQIAVTYDANQPTDQLAQSVFINGQKIERYAIGSFVPGPITEDDGLVRIQSKVNGLLRITLFDEILSEYQRNLNYNELQHLQPLGNLSNNFNLFNKKKY